jgi:tetratricopeptide (TPR) repeat protein
MCQPLESGLARSGKSQGPSSRQVALVALVSALAGPVANAAPDNYAAGPCANVYDTARGPIAPNDYRNQRHLLANVESNHFTPVVENLIRGRSGDLGADLDYVLHIYPNHHRALVAMTRYGERTKSERPPNANYTVDCYYTRAIDFRGDDHVLRALYANYLVKVNRRDEALAQLAAVVKMTPDNPIARYNAGLIYFEMGEFKLARDQAQFAQLNGNPNPGLIDKLKKAGQWVDPPDSAASAASASAAQPAASAASGTF